MASPLLSRPLGDSELSYFLPSRADGVNDMYLHIGFRAPPALVSARRVRTAWAILRARHPLLAAHVAMPPAAYAAARFEYAPPASPAHALADAAAAFAVRCGSKDALIDGYLNGPRTLAAERLSFLVLSSPAAHDPDADAPHEFDILLCAAHFLGDGMALHTCANDLFLLLAGTKPHHDDAALDALLATEWAARWADPAAADVALPPPLEARLPPARHAFHRAACALEFRAAQARLLGGHAFARAPGPAAPRRTAVPTVAFPAAPALAACKARGVSVAHALFALCSVAYADAAADSDAPLLLYSALNLRPHLAPPGGAPSSYWFLAVGYFSVVLPAFRARDARAAFWARAGAAKAQSVRAARAPMLLARARCMAEERGARARAFAALDDGVAAAPAPVTAAPAPVTAAPAPVAAAPAPAAATPGPGAATALAGLSLLGNLDAMYAHGAYDARVALHTLTTGSRQRAGGLLLFAYTFAGRLWVSLGYDVAAYGEPDGEGAVARWWRGVVRGVSEFLVEA